MREWGARAGTVSVWLGQFFGVEVLGVLPEVFEGVVFALFPGKEVNHEVDGIENEPATRLKAVTGVNLDLVILEGFFQCIPEGLEVRI